MKVSKEDKSKTVDTYINKIGKRRPNVALRLKKVRSLIKKSAPKSTEKISWKMPSFYSSNYWLVGYAAFANHIGFFPGPSAVEKFEKDIDAFGLKKSKGTIQLPLEGPIPSSLITKIVKFRVKENQLRAKSK